MFRFRDKTTLVETELTNPNNASFTFLDNGAIFAIMRHGILVNQILGHPVDGGLGNIYVRLHGQADIAHFPVIGPVSDSEFHVADGSVAWEGTHAGLSYRCTLRLDTELPIWFWTLRIHNTGDEAQAIDVVFTQDLGLGAPAAVRTNELYTSQYIDHTVYDDETYGYVICSRQNQEQGQRFPWILHGCLQQAGGYLTDGFQFFGLAYKETNVPVALTQPELPNRKYQYEFALPALTSKLIRLQVGAAAEVTFFAVYEDDHPEATDQRDLAKIKTAAQAFDRLQAFDDHRATSRVMPGRAGVFATAPLFPAQTLADQELDRYFSPERRNVETQGRNVLSFFYGPDYHVVTREKELLTERPHGHIVRSGRQVWPDEDTLSLTAWIYGVFMSHVAIGNTNFNKVLTISRNPLNVLKSSGQRIFVKTSGGYQLLGLPSAFEMGLNSARWIYKGPEATFTVRVWTSLDDPACFLEIAVEGTQELEFLITNNVILGDAEFETSGRVEIDQENKRVELIPAAEEMVARRYPKARFFMVSTDPDRIERIGGDGLLYQDGQDRNHAYVVVKTRPLQRMTLALTGSVLSVERAGTLADKYARQSYSYDTMQRESQEFWRTLRKQATLSITGDEAGDVTRLNDILHWYSHNALIHFTRPYGLEQYSGAAWGLRDVCQGPVEFLLATRNLETIKSALQVVYSHQSWQTGDWPQWFMFDRYRDIYAPDSHGDIIIWPIKAICDYVEASDDLSILDEAVVFMDEETRDFTPWRSSIFKHTLEQIERMEQSCVPGTALARYGVGDWEDTLQPADPAVRQRWVSTWTVELMYQTLRRYRTICERAGREDTAARLAIFCDRMREDFNRYLIKDGVAAGLVHFKPEGVEHLLHPSDKRTGVQYRLLPMSRGMISGMFTPEQMERHLAIIHEHLLFPDGVRLMNRPMSYHGGTERFFKRAETAANFGREIGLQYVHAHLRYVEAMARIGRPEDSFQGLLAVTPISIRDVVPSAVPRQSNAYFSSSDAAFADRYEASQHFDRIKRSEIGVKGGWRIYSSGPGLFMAQLILNLLGLREYFSDILLDPVLPRRLNGLTFEWQYAGRNVRYLYHVTHQGFSPWKVTVNGVDMGERAYAENPYRRGGVLIPRAEFVQALTLPENLVKIHV